MMTYRYYDTFIRYTLRQYGSLTHDRAVGTWLVARRSGTGPPAARNARATDCSEEDSCVCNCIRRRPFRRWPRSGMRGCAYCVRAGRRTYLVGAGSTYSGFFLSMTMPSTTDVSGRYSSVASSARCERDARGSRSRPLSHLGPGCILGPSRRAPRPERAVQVWCASGIR